MFGGSGRVDFVIILRAFSYRMERFRTEESVFLIGRVRALN